VFYVLASLRLVHLSGGVAFVEEGTAALLCLPVCECECAVKCACV